MFSAPLSPVLATRRFFTVAFCFLALICVFAFSGVTKANAQTPLTFTKVFGPDTIGPGSVSTLTFTITNNTGTTADNLAFTDVLPAGVTIAAPAAVSNTCDGTVTAPNGGSTISLTGGKLGAGSGSSCTITVNVTSSTVGAHMNVTSIVTSTAGNSGTATDDLNVVTTRPGFTKSFSPSTVSLGSRSTLTFTINNSANASNVLNLDFTDNLPTGMVIADPADASTTCGTAVLPPTLTAEAGATVITLAANGTFAFPAVAAGATCTVTVDVVATGTGMLGNTTGELLFLNPSFQQLSAGKAGAVLNVPVEPISLTKEFTDDPVAPGGTVNLAFTIINLDRRNDATDISFTDDLDVVLPGLVATGLPMSACGGTLSGTSLLTLSGGTLGAEGSCTFSVSLALPSGSTGTFTNTTSQVTATVDGASVTGSPAEDDLFVVAAPTLTKAFTDDPVSAGGTVTLEFTITNGSAAVSLSDIAFTDPLFDELPSAAALPENGFCGPGSVATFTPAVGLDPPTIAVSGASLDPGAPCTFSITLDVAADASNGIYPNVTSAITGLIDGEVDVEGNPATDDLVIVAPPDISKEFTDDPVSAGSTVTLDFTLTHNQEAPSDATDIEFIDDLSMLDPALPGILATGLPFNACGGMVTTPDGGTTIAFSGGSLTPGEECVISVTLDVPASAAAGSYFNKTGNIKATVAGLSVTGGVGADDLLVTSLTLTKAFTNDPVAPGSNVTLRFTLNQSANASGSATSIFFQDNLDDVLDNLAATGTFPVNDVCGSGNGTLEALGANTLLRFSGASLAPGESCVFDVTVAVPAATAPDTYINTTTSFSADFGSGLVALANATDELVVADQSASIVFTKSFLNDPVVPGSTVPLEFTIEYEGPSDATQLSFTDDLDEVLSGLVATGLPATVCGGGTLNGTSLLELTGTGTLSPGTSCTFTVSLQVPSGAAEGSYLNTTSAITAIVAGITEQGNPATDILTINEGSGGKGTCRPLPTLARIRPRNVWVLPATR